MSTATEIRDAQRTHGRKRRIGHKKQQQQIRLQRNAQNERRHTNDMKFIERIQRQRTFCDC